jgi:hypothetical protein
MTALFRIPEFSLLAAARCQGDDAVIRSSQRQRGTELPKVEAALPGFRARVEIKGDGSAHAHAVEA